MTCLGVVDLEKLQTPCQAYLKARSRFLGDLGRRRDSCWRTGHQDQVGSARSEQREIVVAYRTLRSEGSAGVLRQLLDLMEPEARRSGSVLQLLQVRQQAEQVPDRLEGCQSRSATGQGSVQRRSVKHLVHQQASRSQESRGSERVLEKRRQLESQTGPVD